MTTPRAVSRPDDVVGAWVKQHPWADVTHHVICKRGHELWTGCELTLDARVAIKPRLGARMCERCLQNYRKREKKRAEKAGN
jgi:hypothetical protein